MISIDALKKMVQEIPPLPDLVLRLLAMCRDPEIPPRDIVEVIKLDPAITMKVLRLCNSPFYGLPRKVTSLQEALVYLGTDALVNFVLAGCLSNFCGQENKGYGLQKGELWRHAVGVAICSQKVAEHSDPRLSGSAFTCGLLHDIGKIIMNSFVAEAFRKMILMVENDGYSFLEAEKLVLGYTHPEAGGDIAEYWNLPSEIVESIRYHHDPMLATEHQKLVAIVHVGNILCVSFGIGVGSDGLAYLFHPAALNLLNISIEQLFQLSVEIHDRFKNAEALLNIT